MEKRDILFAQRLRELRGECGLSQYQLAGELGVSRGLIGNYEQGSREPDYVTLAGIARYFGVSVDYILGLTDDTGGAAQEFERKFLMLSDGGRRDAEKYLDMLAVWEKDKEKEQG